MHIKELQRVLADSEVNVGIIFDGTTSFSEVKHIMVRLVMKDFCIYELVGRVRIFRII